MRHQKSPIVRGRRVRVARHSHHWVAALCCVAALALASADASAQSCMSFAPGFGPPPGALGLDGTVYAMTVFDEDGWGPALPSLFVGGSFTSAGGVAVSGIARWDGTAWHDVAGGVTGDTASVYALAVVDLDGDWRTAPSLYVGGDFATAGTVPAANIACWNGTTWSALGSGTSGNFGVVRCIGEYAADPTGARLYAGGDFNNAGGVALNFIARWNGVTWTALGATIGTSGGVFALQPWNDGSGPALFVGGAFATAGTAPSTGFIAKWNGTAWSSLGPGLNSSVYALAVWDADGPGPIVPALAAGGAFTTTAGGGTALNRVGTWNGTLWAGLGGGVGSSGAVRCLMPFDDQCGRSLYAGGDFFAFPGVAFIGRWINGLWLPAGLGTISAVRSLMPFAHDNGTRIALYAGGEFTAAGGIPSSRIAQWIAADTDGDGLYDCWETENQGIDIDCDGDYDLDLYALDARVNRKDIFVEIDTMPGFAPLDAALQDVRDKFDVAPVTAPGTLPGIKLHAAVDESDIPHAIWSTNAAGWASGFDAVKADKFGTFDQRNDPQSADILAAKRLAYHYCIFAEEFHVNGWTGIAEIGGNDLLVTLGSSGGTHDEQAGTFMHELGHNLGLWHGGHQADPYSDDRYNYKPNYFSVMNYTWQFPMTGYAGSWELGYSSGLRDALDEDLIVENDGLDGDVSKIVPVHVLVFAPPFDRLVWEGGPISLNEDRDPNDSFTLDINHLAGTVASPGDDLEDHDDWSSLDYNFRDDSDFADGVHASVVALREMDDATRLMLSSLTPAPALCAADVNNDNSVNVTDLLAIIGAWGTCGDPHDCPADVSPSGGDDVVNVTDLLAVIGAWGACP